MADSIKTKNEADSEGAGALFFKGCQGKQSDSGGMLISCGEERNLISLSKAHGVIKRLTVP